MTTPLDQFHDRVRRKVRDLTPKIAVAYLAGLAALLDLIREERALLSAGLYEQFIAEVLTDERIAAAFAAYRASLIDAIGDSMRYAARAIPGVTAAQVATMPNMLDPIAFRSIQGLDRIAMTRLSDEIRAMAREVFRQGGTAAEVAQRLYRSLGLGPSQVADVLGFRTEQIAIDPALTVAQIEKAVLRYSEQRIAANAATVSRTSALMAHKRGADLAWQYVIDSGMVPAGLDVWKRWVQVQRPTRRVTHAQVNGVTIRFGERYPNGDMVPGDGDPWNCQCQSYIFMQ